MYMQDGKLITNFSRRLLAGHPPLDPRSEGIPKVNEAQAEALDAIHFTAKKMELHTTMHKGDIRLINNMGIFHRREMFEDKAGEMRHLIRIWLNNETMCWKLPRPLRLAWARVYEDGGREEHWDLAPMQKDGVILRVAGSCD
jgi:Taurine catabolism dioxygenase TauD, TfdA family